MLGSPRDGEEGTGFFSFTHEEDGLTLIMDDRSRAAFEESALIERVTCAPDRWRALAAVSGDLGRDIAMDLAACDAALMNAALEAEATYGGESREAAVQYALLEECRQRDARHRKDDDEGFPLSSAEAELELVERLNSSREYVSWLRQYRAERRRLSAARHPTPAARGSTYAAVPRLPTRVRRGWRRLCDAAA